MLPAYDDVNADGERVRHHSYIRPRPGDDTSGGCDVRGVDDAAESVRRHDGYHDGRDRLDRSHKHCSHLDHLLFTKSQGTLGKPR